MALLERLRALCGPSVRLRPRRGQALHIAVHGARGLWLIESGCVVLQQRLPADRRQVLLVLFAGDAFDAAWAPALPGLELVATAPSEVLRTQAPAAPAPTSAADDGGEAETARGELARHMLVCLAQHAACLGRLSGEERVAALLIGLARRLGAPEQARAVLLPLSRRDVADCLALNPDTVSRILSELRRRRVLAQPSRNEIMIKDWAALTALSPMP